VESEIAFLLARDVQLPATIHLRTRCHRSSLRCRRCSRLPLRELQVHPFRCRLGQRQRRGVLTSARSPADPMTWAISACSAATSLIGGDVAMTATGAAVMGHPAHRSPGWPTSSPLKAKPSRPANSSSRRSHRTSPRGGRCRSDLRIRGSGIN
jgi:hypothetical protein